MVNTQLGLLSRSFTVSASGLEMNIFAVSELMSCADIPIKVTINEVIELAKRYSTDKSGTFINGILDAIIEELQSNNLIVKSGRVLS